MRTNWCYFPLYILKWHIDLKAISTRHTHIIAISARAMRWVCHLIAYRRLPKSCFQMASVLSVNRQQPALLIASFFEKLILDTILWLMIIWWYSYLIYTELVPCDFILCMLGNFSQFFVVCWYFFRIIFSRKIISGMPSECQTVSIKIRPDTQSVGPDLDPNSLQRLSAVDTSKSLSYDHL